MKQIKQKELLLLTHNFQVRFALFCAHQVKQQWEPIPEAVRAIRITELWLDNKATSEECKFAANAAGEAADRVTNVTKSAAYATANAANAAGWASANAAVEAAYCSARIASGYAKSIIIEDQWDYYNQLLTFHEEFERVMLK